jgi:predicted ABC-type ATPase
MRNINNWNNFINEEFSKNNPIPELSKKEKLGIILLGTPGSGKSTYIKNVILPINRNFKSFSTDDVSFKLTGDANRYDKRSTSLNLSYLDNYIKTGQNFVYDTTGANQQAIYNVCKESYKNGYKIIFILLLIDIETTKKFNKARGMMGGHQADDDYIDFVYNIQNQTTKNYIKTLKPDNFYIVLNRGIDRSYKYFKHTGDEILKRKVDKYIPMKK